MTCSCIFVVDAVSVANVAVVVVAVVAEAAVVVAVVVVINIYNHTTSSHIIGLFYHLSTGMYPYQL